MSTGMLVLIICLFDTIFVTALSIALVRFGWNPVHEKYPPQEPSPDAVSRNFQSFKLGHMNFGWSMHVTVDESHLHITPAKVFRKMGMKPASIPWDAITDIKRTSYGRKYLKAKLGRQALVGPAWCLELAMITEDAENGGNDRNDDTISA